MASKVVETQYFLPLIACYAVYHCLTTKIHFPFLYSSGGKQQFLWSTETIHPQNTVYDSEYLVENTEIITDPSSTGDEKKTPKIQTLPEVRTNVTHAFQKFHFNVLFWKKGLTEQYFCSVSGAFIMPSIIIAPPSNRNFIMYSNWWAQSFSSHNKWSSTGFISRTTMVSSGQVLRF